MPDDHLPWYEGRLAAFDTETTGVDVERDRIVSAALVVCDSPAAPPRVDHWLIDPGVPMPEAARAVHGLDTELLRARGRRPSPALAEVAAALGALAVSRVPLVVMNAPFDLTLLDRELRRHRGEELAAYLSPAAPRVLDPRVLDKYVDRYRPGRRTLTDLCAHYGVALTDAHDAAADARAALDLTRAVARRHPDRLGALHPAELHARQAVWHAAQARGLQAWFAAQGTSERVDPAWPLRPWLPPQRQAPTTAPDPAA
jgi:DNA polymerase-3 subunit epsilon